MGKTPKHYKTQTTRHTSSLMFWCTQRANLFQTALSWIQRTCQDRRSILPQKHTITCNYTPLGPSYLSLLHVTRISTRRSSSLRCVPLAALTNTLSSMWKTNCAVTQIPSRKVRLIKEINISLPTAVAYTQTRVMSCHLCCVTESSE